MRREARGVLAILLLAGCLDAPGMAPVLVAEPDTIDLGLASFDAPPAEHSFAVRNDGGEVARIDAVALDGPAASAFVVDASDGESLFPGGTFTVSISANPQDLVGLRDPATGRLELSTTLDVRATAQGDTQPSSGCGAGGSGPATAVLSVPVVWLLSCDFDLDGAEALGCGGADCDDTDPERSPLRPELCDEIDHDCDGSAESTADQDGDGAPLCVDCDDDDASNTPGGEEVCDGADNDCSGAADHPGGEVDVDEDGSLSCIDCDDTDASNSPGGTEVCDGADNDCSGAADHPGGEVDVDGDGSLSCIDCDDTDASNTPGGEEVCDGADNDCSGAADHPGGEVDVDEDGSLSCIDCDDTDASNTPGGTEVCDGADNDCSGAADHPDGEVDVDGDGSLSCVDCDDTDASNTPGGTEVCDGADNDCSGAADHPDGEVDVDGDGSLSCVDCDDTDAARAPTLPELCDGVDSDCSGGADASGGETDGDQDGFLACDECDDGDPAVFPGAPELCNGVDDDCDGLTGPPGSDADEDGDGWWACEECDDTAATVHPGAEELCDGIDNDCDVDVDEDMLLVPEDYGSVQAGLDAAADGDVVCVGPGTWVESIVFGGVAAQVVGRQGSAWTTLEGVDPYPTVQINSGEPPGSLLQGFTVTHGGEPILIGGAIHASGVDVVLEDLVITGVSRPNTASAVGIFQGSAVIENVEISNTLGGGAGLKTVDAVVDAWGLRLLDNLATGAIFQGGTVVLRDLLVTDNGQPSAGAVGGLSVTEGADVVVLGGLVANNQGTGGGGVLVHGSSFQAQNLRVVGNGAWVWGSGGLFVVESNVVLERSALVGNTSAHTSALRCHDSVVVVSDSEVSSHLGTSSWGAVGTALATACAFSFERTNFWDNGPFTFSGLPSPVGSSGNTSVNPQYLDTSSADPADWDLHLSSTSPLVDAGDPLAFDPDGSPSDVGAWSGPDANAVDLDGDGAPSWWHPGPYDPASDPALGWDCDDEDANVGPWNACGP